jgi:hypothetical protein
LLVVAESGGGSFLGDLDFKPGIKGFRGLRQQSPKYQHAANQTNQTKELIAQPRNI